MQNGYICTMIIYDILNSNKKITNVLIKFGVLPSRYASALNVYHTYLDYKNLNECKKSEAIAYCVKAFKCSQRRIYNIIEEMETDTFYK